MPADFYPKREADIRNWSSNFSAKINAAPGDYGLTGTQASDYATLQESFASLYHASRQPTTRTPSIIEAKNTARIALEDSTRQLAGIIRAHPGVDQAQRIGLGLAARDPGGPRGRTWSREGPQGAENSPLMTVIAVSGRSVRVRLRDRKSPMNPGKPRDVSGATILSYVGSQDEDQPPMDRLKWSFHGNTSRTIHDVKFGASVPPGSRVWLTAFWSNRRAQRGPACEPVSAYLQFGLAIAA